MKETLCLSLFLFAYSLVCLFVRLFVCLFVWKLPFLSGYECTFPTTWPRLLGNFYLLGAVLDVKTRRFTSSSLSELVRTVKLVKQAKSNLAKPVKQVRPVKQVKQVKLIQPVKQAYLTQASQAVAIANHFLAVSPRNLRLRIFSRFFFPWGGGGEGG